MLIHNRLVHHLSNSLDSNWPYIRLLDFFFFCVSNKGIEYGNDFVTRSEVKDTLNNESDILCPN